MITWAQDAVPYTVPLDYGHGSLRSVYMSSNIGSRHQWQTLSHDTSIHRQRMLDSAGSSSLSIIFWPLDTEQVDRWTWLVVIASTILRLAKPLVRNRRLPWERPRPPYRLTPYRVQRAVSALLPGLGTPADPAKPCGRSPGRPKALV